jgi:hypothetical protein
MNNIKLMIVKTWSFLDLHSYFTDFGRQNVEASVNLISAFAKETKNHLKHILIALSKYRLLYFGRPTYRYQFGLGNTKYTGKRLEHLR